MTRRIAAVAHSPYAKAKDKIRLRFDFGTDCGTGFFGRYIDDVSVYGCK